MADHRISRVVLGLAAALLLGAATASADRVVMKDGRVFDGAITKETRTSVTIDTLISNISTTMTLARRDIESIEKGPAGAPPDSGANPAKAREPADMSREERGEDPSSRPRPERAPAGATRYLVVPIQGVFGEDIAPPGVADAIEYASRRGIDHVVFHIKSPGGYTWAADAIAEAMAAAPRDMRLIAWIEEAISASIWVVFGCDEVFVAPGATIGAAVTYSRDNTTGATEVDQKLNSALAGKIAAMAESHGRSGVVARAMFLPEAEAWLVEGPEGDTRIVDRDPGAGATKIDGPDTVLTLTAAEAIKWGLATPASSIDEIGAALGAEGWTKHNDYGAAAMRKAGEALARGEGNVPMMLDRLGALVGTINSAIEEAVATSPENGSYMVHPDSGLMVTESQREWQRRTDASIGAFERALSRIGEYEKTQRELEAMGVEVGAHELNVKDVRGQIQRRLQELRSNRDRRYL